MVYHAILLFFSRVLSEQEIDVRLTAIAERD